MKKLSTKQLIALVVACVALLVFCLGFLVSYKMKDNGYTFTYLNVIWGSGKYRSQTASTTTIVTMSDKLPALPAQIIALFTILAGGVLACLTVFAKQLQKNAKMITLLAGGLIVLGGILILLTGPSFFAVVAKDSGVTVKQMKDVLRGTSRGSVFSIILGIVSILAGGCFAALPFTKFGK